MQKTATLNPGATLKRGYEIVKVLGQGGFGITYEAVHTSLKTRFAIKEFFLSGFCVRSVSNTVAPQSISTEKFNDFKDKFLKEAQTLAQFDHPNIVRVTDIFEENKTAYMVMQYVEGDTLQQIIKKEGKLPEQKAVEYIRQIASALAEMHKNNILHRDLKPVNIIINKSDKAVLIDFGTARDFADGKTITHTAMLTPGYAPPEQYSERKQRGPFSDIYSLGATLYCCLTGNKPLQATDREDEDDATDHLVVPRESNPEITTQTERVLLKSLSIKTRDRYQSISEFLLALDTEYKPEPLPEKAEPADDATIILSGPDDKTLILHRIPEVKNQKPEEKKKRKKGLLILVLAISFGAIFLMGLIITASYYQTKEVRQQASEKEPDTNLPIIQYGGNKYMVMPTDLSGTYTWDEAKNACENLTSNGYSDWFLPSKDVLNVLYINRSEIGGFSSDYYWSSSEDDAGNAWRQDFDYGGQGSGYKVNARLVRCVRSF